MKKTRRTFIKNAVMGTAGTFAIPDLIPSYLPGKTAPSKRINIGVIGIGRQTVNPNIPQFLQSEHAQVVAVCDVDAWRLENGRIGKVERIFMAVPAELSGSALSPEPTMPVPSELNYDMWLGPAWEAPYTEKRVHAVKAYGRPGWMRVDSYCNGMISNWGAHLMGIVQWGNDTEYTGPVIIEGTGEFDKGLWNTLNRFEIRYRFANGVEVFYRIERPYVRFEGTGGWVEVEYPDKITASTQEMINTPPGAGELSFKDLLSDKEDFLTAIKDGKQTAEPLETAHRTISMCQLGLIAIKTGSRLTWNPDNEEIINDNAASAMLDIPVREKYFK